ncbi:hypothetical protein EI94DRAFT_1706831 [Lactarius quietus]|nr:hypothetical protein EI94DRAFT_1706831 [Lactarius quietus]
MSKEMSQIPIGRRGVLHDCASPLAGPSRLPNCPPGRTGVGMNAGWRGKSIEDVACAARQCPKDKAWVVCCRQVALPGGVANRHRIRIRFQQAEEDISDDSDLSDQEEEHELPSDNASESDVSEVLDFGYERPGSDEESEGNQSLSGSDPGDQDDDRGLEDDPIGFGPEESENEGEAHDEFDEFGFASF